jgi:phage baseplate assembly protein W
MAAFKGIRFPLQKGKQSFPDKVEDSELIRQSIIQILLTEPGERCFPGDTPIPLLDGTTRALSALVGMDPFWVYSLDPKSQCVVPGKATAHQTGKVSTLLEVTLDSGETARCTPEHLWMLRDGSYLPANKLEVGTSLMPLYRKVSDAAEPRGYELVKFGDGRWVFTHRLVAEHLEMLDSSKKIVHHKNFKKLDNSPNNLAGVTPQEHRKLHLECVARMNTPEVKARAAVAIRRNWANPEFASKHKARLSKLVSKTNSRADSVKRMKTQSVEMGQRFWSAPEFEEDRKRNLVAKRLGQLADLEKGNESKIRAATRQRWGSALPEDKASCQRTIAAATQTIERLNKEGLPMKRKCQKLLARFAGEVQKPLDELTWEQWRARIPNNFIPKWRALVKWLPEVAATNHKVSKIKKLELEQPAPVFDLHVEHFHNFALGCGVFVHNCMRPTFGSGLMSRVFENNDAILEASLQAEIFSAVGKWEPRAIVRAVNVIRKDSTVTVTVDYVIVATRQLDTVSLAVSAPQ